MRRIFILRRREGYITAASKEDCWCPLFRDFCRPIDFSAAIHLRSDPWSRQPHLILFILLMAFHYLGLSVSAILFH